MMDSLMVWRCLFRHVECCVTNKTSWRRSLWHSPNSRIGSTRNLRIGTSYPRYQWYTWRDLWRGTSTTYTAYICSCIRIFLRTIVEVWMVRRCWSRLLLIRKTRRPGWLLLLLLVVDVFALLVHVHCLCQSSDGGQSSAATVRRRRRRAGSQIARHLMSTSITAQRRTGSGVTAVPSANH